MKESLVWNDLIIAEYLVKMEFIINGLAWFARSVLTEDFYVLMFISYVLISDLDKCHKNIQKGI